MAVKPVQEWEQSRRWNPFNSYKVLAHVDRWSRIRRGRPIPSPVLITVDPSNVCNFNCIWCNAEFVRKHRKGSLSKQALLAIADLLPAWGQDCSDIESGVKAVCIAGGGEPLLNPHTAEFIDQLRYRGIEVGLVTNGSMLDDYIDPLSLCTWVGVSIDAGKSETFDKLKRTSPEKGYFNKVIDNIANLADYASRHNHLLGFKHPAYGISYKYLLHKENITEILEASKLAKEIGCKNIHFRPASTTWDKIGTDEEIIFGMEEIRTFQEQIAEAIELTDENFGVFGVTHKFNSQFQRANHFVKCYAIFMTALITPPEDGAPPDSFVLGLCCDRRGDPKLELARSCQVSQEIIKLWGSKHHWRIHDKIDVLKDCPRCTYQPHNEVFEQVILNDSMTYKFI